MNNNFLLGDEADGFDPAPVGKKYDGGKAPIVRGFMNYFPRAIEAVALVSKFGAEKYEVAYEDQNWRDVPCAFLRYTDALGRHLLGDSKGEAYDPESTMLHAAHAAWDALARLELILMNGEDIYNPDVGNQNAKAQS